VGWIKKQDLFAAYKKCTQLAKKSMFRVKGWRKDFANKCNP
jgi:hypothetical protein